MIVGSTMFSFKNVSLLTASAALVLLVLTGGCSPESGRSSDPEIGPDHLEIALQYDVGKRYLFEFDMSYETDFGEALGNLLPEGQRATQTQQFSVGVLEATPSGGRKLEFEFLETRFDIDMGGVKASFNSQDQVKEGDPFADMYAGLTQAMGHPISVELDADLQVVSTDGIEGLRQQVLSNANPQLEAMVQGMFSESYIANLTRPSGIPERPVQPGDSWPLEITQDLGALGRFVTDQQYQFKNLENHQDTECALMTFSGTVKGGSKAESEGMSQMMEITGGKTSGKMWYDPRVGQFIDASTEQDLKMRMAVPGIPAEAMQGGGLMLEVRQTMRRRLVRVDDIGASDETQSPPESGTEGP